MPGQEWSSRHWGQQSSGPQRPLPRHQAFLYLPSHCHCSDLCLIAILTLLLRLQPESPDSQGCTQAYLEPTATVYVSQLSVSSP